MKCVKYVDKKNPKKILRIFKNILIGSISINKKLICYPLFLLLLSKH